MVWSLGTEELSELDDRWRDLQRVFADDPSREGSTNALRHLAGMCLAVAEFAHRAGVYGGAVFDRNRRLAGKIARCMDLMDDWTERTARCEIYWVIKAASAARACCCNAITHRVGDRLTTQHFAVVA